MEACSRSQELVVQCVRGLALLDSGKMLLSPGVDHEMNIRQLYLALNRNERELYKHSPIGATIRHIALN
jgi:hypothetical protein